MNAKREKLLELFGKLSAMKSASDWIPDAANRKAFEETADEAMGVCKALLQETPRELARDWPKADG
jgi:hypothetical protein